MWTIASCGSLISFSQSYDWTGLILSSRKGHVEIVKMLLDKGADINKTTADVSDILM